MIQLGFDDNVSTGKEILKFW